MQLRHILLAALLSTLTACPGTAPPDDDDSAPGDDDDSAPGDDDDAGPGDDDDSAPGDDDDSAVEEPEIADAPAYCGPEPEPLPPENLFLNVLGPGTVAVTQWNYVQGCCPEIEIELLVDPEASTLATTYSLSNDNCDCICDVDISYEIGGIPAGDWTLSLPNGVSRAFTVQ
jgi:hypothetical protein